MQSLSFRKETPASPVYTGFLERAAFFPGLSGNVFAQQILITRIFIIS